MKNIKDDVKNLVDGIKELLLLKPSVGVDEIDGLLDLVIAMSYTQGRKDALEEILLKK